MLVTLCRGAKTYSQNHIDFDPKRPCKCIFIDSNVVVVVVYDVLYQIMAQNLLFFWNQLGLTCVILSHIMMLSWIGEKGVG